MKKYRGMIKQGVKVGFSYRANFFVGLIRIPILLVIYYYLWKAIFGYNGTEAIKGFTFHDMIVYYGLSMLVAIFTWCDVESWMEDEIRTGEIVSSFLRPLNYIYATFSEHLGIVVLGISVQLPLVLAILIFFIKMNIPSLLYLLIFIVSVALAIIMSFLISFCIGLLAFWLSTISGLRRIKSALMAFLEGGLIPLTFFPASALAVFKFLPFMYMRFVPINIFLQKYDLTTALSYLLIELIWIVLLYLLAVFTYKRAFKRFAGSGV